jgi:hypothetical protein
MLDRGDGERGLLMRWRRALTDNELAQLRGVAADAEGFAAGTAVLRRFYELALADLGTSPAEVDAHLEGPLDPTGFAIPEGQWLAICAVLHDRARVARDADGLLRTEDPAFMWMNTGPTTYLAEQQVEVLDQECGRPDLGLEDEDELSLVHELEP